MNAFHFELSETAGQSVLARNTGASGRSPTVRSSPVEPSHPPLSAWAPLTVAEVVSVFHHAPFRWWINGGHALELHLERSWRDHGDIDVGVLGSDARLLHDSLTDWDLWIANNGMVTPWTGTRRNESRSENSLWACRPEDLHWAFDISLESGDTTEWRYRRDDSIRRPWDQAILQTTDGIPYISPELQLLFKSKEPREKDHQDAVEVIPVLNQEQTRFLADNLGDGHPWRAHLRMP